MKRLRILLLAASFLLTLAACGGSGQDILPTGTWGESNWSQVRWGE